MKLGELVDAIRRLESAEADVEFAQSCLRHGGSPTTMVQKNERLTNAERWLKDIRDEDVGVQP